MSKEKAEESALIHFELGSHNFLRRDGRARIGGQENPSQENPSQKKLCFTSTEIEPMAELLYALSEREDCWFVKFDAEPGKHGMIRGRCFLMDEEAVAGVWRDHKNTDQILCTVQDDDFTKKYRDL